MINYKHNFLKQITNHIINLWFVFIFAGTQGFAQEITEFEKIIYTDSAGNVFVHEKMEIYLFFTPENDTSEKHLVPSPSQHANPMYLDGHGEHFITHHDPVSGKTIRHKVFADGIPPKSSLNVMNGLIMQFDDRFYCEGKIKVEVLSEDEYSGVSKSYYSIDNKEFILYDIPFKISEGEAEQISFFSVDNVGNVEKASTAMLIFDIEEIMDLENIYFSHDCHNLNDEAQQQLDVLAEALKKFPEIKIELRSHTDARGSSIYNQGLSERRAMSTRRYLISKGISPHRLTAKGFGDSKIINHCYVGVECSDEEHRENRRTEFRIIPFHEE